MSRILESSRLNEEGLANLLTERVSVTLCTVRSTASGIHFSHTVRIVLCPRSDRSGGTTASERPSATRPTCTFFHPHVFAASFSTLDSRLSSIASLSQTPAKDTCRRNHTPSRLYSPPPFLLLYFSLFLLHTLGDGDQHLAAVARHYSSTPPIQSLVFFLQFY